MVRQYLIVLCLFIMSTPGHAKNSYSIELKDLDYGRLQWALVQKGKDWFVYKNTNLFDQKNNLGKFKVKNISVVNEKLTELNRLEKSLENIESITSRKLVEKNTFQHQRFYKLGKYKVQTIDTFFPKLKNIFLTLMDSLELEVLEGVKVTQFNQKEILLDKTHGGKVTKVKMLPERTCSSRDKKIQICKHDDYGILYLKGNNFSQ